MGTSCAQLFTQFYTDQLEALHFMVWRWASGFGMIINLIVSLFLTFELSHFWGGLNTIKVHSRGYLMRTTPPT